MELIIISGLSGAGKSRVANLLEDWGCYCVDNMPMEMIPKFAEFCVASHGRYERVALVADIRSGDSFDPLLKTVEETRALGVKCVIIFLEAATGTIITRYQQTRRRHPLAGDGERIEDVIAREIDRLRPVRAAADRIIDTTDLSKTALREILLETLGDDSAKKASMVVNVVSFGFKYGAPVEADWMLDVRFLPNPYYEDNLRELTGMDPPVRDYVFGYAETTEFLEKLFPLLRFVLPLYVAEGRKTLTIAVGCTGGQHRSTAIAAEVAKYIRQQGYESVLLHKDIHKRSR